MGLLGSASGKSKQSYVKPAGLGRGLGYGRAEDSSADLTPQLASLYSSLLSPAGAFLTTASGSSAGCSFSWVVQASLLMWIALGVL